MACREHLARVREREADFARLGAAVLVISFEPPAEAAEFARREGLPFPILSDPERRAYAAFGLTRGTVPRDQLGRTIRYYLQAFLHGHWPRRPRGDTRQLGGDFVLDPAGRIVYAHPERGPADRPPV